MGFHDAFKNSYLESFTGHLSLETIFLALIISCVLALYLFCVYRLVTRNTFYNRNFNISLVALTLITTAIILSIQSSVVISLGMVGALSIVRFRTAVREPLDLVFLFWAISIGIICGTGLFEIAAVTSLLLTAVILTLNHLPSGRTSLLLVVDTTDIDSETRILDLVKNYSSWQKVKSRNMSPDNLNLVIDLRIRKEAECLRQVCALEGVTNATLLSHDGEVAGL